MQKRTDSIPTVSAWALVLYVLAISLLYPRAKMTFGAPLAISALLAFVFVVVGMRIVMVKDKLKEDAEDGLLMPLAMWGIYATTLFLSGLLGRGMLLLAVERMTGLG